MQHQNLFISLLQKGNLRILKAMYSKLSETVPTDSGETNVSPRDVETRKRDVTSPLFFALFINDLCTLLREWCGDGTFTDIFYLKYPDNVANCAETRVRLQKQINLVGEFCDSREMKGNLS